MPKFLLPLALSALLIPALSAQESQEAKPAQQQAEPEKKPDAFKYFFGKEREQKKETEAPKAPEGPKAAPVEKAPEPAPTKPAPVVAPEPAPVAAPSEVRPEPPTVAQPELAKPVPAPQPAPRAEPPRKVEETPKADAFKYFFGRAAQPLPEPQKEKAADKPLSAFDYFFGKDGKADQPEEPASPPPV